LSAHNSLYNQELSIVLYNNNNLTNHPTVNMKYTAFAIAATAQVASAHYFFETNIINGAATRPFQYIRDFTRPTKFNPIKFSTNPAADIRDGSTIDGPDIICNQGAFSNAGTTEVLTVNAGDEVRVKLGVGAKMQHPGPSFVYMSRAPGDDVKAYDGTGDWFKIFEEGVCNEGADFTTNAWCSYDKDELAAVVPADTPDGEYLFRVEHIGVHRSHVNQPEHYVSCVQIKVENGGTGTPGPMTQFPGTYSVTDDYANFSIYNGFKPFPMSGPAVWSSGSAGGNTGGSAPPAEAPVESTPAPANPPAESSPAPAPAPAPANPPAANCGGLWQQCGGNGFAGASCCSSGNCEFINDWYSQCV
jgi:hypothetical protein